MLINGVNVLEIMTKTQIVSSQFSRITLPIYLDHVLWSVLLLKLDAYYASVSIINDGSMYLCFGFCDFDILENREFVVSKHISTKAYQQQNVWNLWNHSQLWRCFVFFCAWFGICPFAPILLLIGQLLTDSNDPSFNDTGAVMNVKFRVARILQNDAMYFI